MGKPSVLIENVSKKFSLSLKASLKYGLLDCGRRVFRPVKKTEDGLRPGEFWALKGVSLTIEPGDALGIMGVNGSGKTTLLRILNGTYSPDGGRIVMRGRVGSLIAAGAGFSPMLTGRENIFVSGSILGIKPQELRARFDEIVHFSGLEEFIDMPVRNYSSGMSVRLGFAVAVLGSPDILLMDEVLAVGDMSFQKRCYERIFQLRQNGTAIVLVSHSIGAIWAVCNCGLFLDKGLPSEKLSVEELCKAYDLVNSRSALPQDEDCALEDTNSPETLSQEYGNKVGGTGDVIVRRFEILDPETDEQKTEFAFGADLEFKMHIEVFNPIDEAIFRYSIDSIHYKFICTQDSSFNDGPGLVDLTPGRYVVTTTLSNQRLRPGTYFVNLNVCQKNVGVHLYYRCAAAAFIIKQPEDRLLHDKESPAVVTFDANFALAGPQA